MVEEKIEWASLAALANTGFGFTLFINGFIYTGIVTLPDVLGLLVVSLVVIIGVGYFIAGVIELRRGAEAPGYVIMAYSMFGFIIGFLYLFSYAIPIFTPPTPTVLLIFWIFWIFFSILSGIILRPMGKLVAINLYWLAITFALFAAAGWGNTSIEFVAGVFAFAQGIYNWYLFSAIAVNSTFKKLILPLG